MKNCNFQLGWMAILGAFIYSSDGASAEADDLRRTAFFQGSIGTELMPLVVAKTLPELYPNHFRPNPNRGNWVEQFGFIQPAAPSPHGLPLGFTVSNRFPKSGDPSPIPFVGFACATCHTTVIRESLAVPGTIVVGTGNASLNLFGWLDAFQAALNDDSYNLNAINDFLRKSKSEALTDVEAEVVSRWIEESRTQLRAGFPKYDEPFSNGLSLLPDFVPTGPARTQPFRTLVREGLQRPGIMSVYTKIAPVFHEDRQHWAQVDGGISDPKIRSAMAAFAAGATVKNLGNPAIAKNVTLAAEYTLKLEGPRFESVFPNFKLADSKTLALGKRIYERHCHNCHGGPNDSRTEWGNGTLTGIVIPADEIATDPEGIKFRHYKELPEKLRAAFGDGHPFSYEKGVVRTTDGYIAKPIDSAFARAPFLHNGSVLTLAELINLEPRRTVFYRGDNTYDVDALGLKSPTRETSQAYFMFDTRVAGNSNAGHNYPWTYQGSGWNRDDLRALLEFLRTL